MIDCSIYADVESTAEGWDALKKPATEYSRAQVSTCCT
jgi:hypothetical protein